MNEHEFIFWLKGYTDSMGADMPTREQWDKIRHELALIFNKITPYRPYMGSISSVGSSFASAAPLTGEVPWANQMITC